MDELLTPWQITGFFFNFSLCLNNVSVDEYIEWNKTVVRFE